MNFIHSLDHRNETGYDWLLISWSPDDAPIRQKMLYASTKATLKQEFGNNCISEELHGTSEVLLFIYIDYLSFVCFNLICHIIPA